MTAPSIGYDEVPYEEGLNPLANPSRIAAVATLFGLAPASPRRCRVLELGCATGGNLIALAECSPDSTFVGVDFSAEQIATATARTKALDLGNIELHAAGIEDVDATWGQFDYIIAHGVLSWVPPAVRGKLLDICAGNLAPQGVAYVSYNANPGWRTRGIVRDLMLQCMPADATAHDQIARARAVLANLAATVNVEPYATIIKAEHKLVENSKDFYLFHDFLEPVNDPFYVRDFVELARQHHLGYLGEADIRTMCPHNFGPVITGAAELPPTNQIEAEQFMDFATNRMFRSTLLVHAALQPSWRLEAARVRFLHVASAGTPAGSEPIDIASTAPVQYRTLPGLVLETDQPVMKAALGILRQRWPGTIPFGELLDETGAALSAAGAVRPLQIETILAEGLLRTCVLAGFTELYGAPVVLPRRQSARPIALASARRIMSSGQSKVGNIRHEIIDITNAFEKKLLVLLDGTRDRAALTREMMSIASSDEIASALDGQTIADPVAAAATAVDHALKDLHDIAVLVA